MVNMWRHCVLSSLHPASSDIPLPNENSVSRQHAEIEVFASASLIYTSFPSAVYISVLHFLSFTTPLLNCFFSPHCHQDDNSRPPRIVVKDVGSRFGTYVNGNRLSFGEVFELSNGSILQLGAASVSFRVVRKMMVFCATNLSPGEKEEAQAFVKTLGQ